MHDYPKEETSITDPHWINRISNEDKRKQHKNRTAKEQFVSLMYNDLLPYLIIKGSTAEVSKDSGEETADENNGNVFIFDANKTVIIEDFSQQDICNLMINSEGNEMAHVEENNVDLTEAQMMNIRFVNGNTYKGCVDRTMLEGRGEYWWNNGETYKGHFHENHMSDRGMLEWNNGCWYEGDFHNGYRHGKGLIVNPNNHFMYTGDWHFGRKHGQGYCCRGNNDFYEGNWAMDQMDGTGTRNYPNGEQYTGQWKNNVRHGIGMMTWRNGDVYYGEWANGYMHGYGEYIWKNSTDPSQRISYIGNWHQGVRHGEGSLTLGSVKYPEQLRSPENDNNNDSVILTEIHDDDGVEGEAHKNNSSLGQK